MLIVAFILHMVFTERDIADGEIEKTVGQIGSLITLNGNTALLIELLCNTAGDAVQLHTERLAVSPGWVEISIIYGDPKFKG